MASTKPTKKSLIDALVERGTHHRPALQKMTLAALEALLAEQPVEESAAAEPEQPAEEKPAPTKRRARTLEATVDGYRVRVGAWANVHDTEGHRVAVLRRDAIASLASAQPAKQMRVMTAYVLPEGASQIEIGWVRNGVKPVTIGRIVAKAIKAAEASK